ncbi:MAG TPA: FtsX-like permease family protein [Patescibacteria group bacterium]|nr:FtsX-like permease family protein [Patescibacteria group bacterium]
MKIIDAYILARTKRKTRRIRMALVTIVSSLLFAVLFFGALSFAGVQKSSARFQDYGYNGRHLTQASMSGNPFSADFNTLQKQITDQMDADLLARKIKVTDEMRARPEYVIELGRRIGAVALADSTATQKQFEASVQKKFSPKATYHLSYINALQLMQPGTADDPDPLLTQQLQQVETGVGKNGPMFNPNEALPTFLSVEPDMLKPMLIAGQTLAWKPGQPYPVEVPYSYLQQLSKKSFNKLSSEDKIKGYQALIKQYTGQTLQYCYRNSTAQTQLASVLTYNYDAKKDNDPKTKPLDVAACTGFDQKLLKTAGLLPGPDPDAPKPLFPQPAAPAPDTHFFRVKIVGFVPTTDQGPGDDIFGSLFSSVDNWPVPMPIIMPQAVVNQEPFLSSTDNLYGFGNQPTLFFDFNTRAEQKHFIDSTSCKGNDCTKNNEWTLTTFGSIKTAFEGVFAKGIKVGKWITLGVATLAATLVLLTISKLISDNRREIAVFRALGARQRDIAQIYFTYGFMLAVTALIVSITFAVIAALVFSSRFADRFNNLLVQAVGSYQNPGHSTLLGLHPLWMLAIALVLLLATMIGVAIPVLLSRRRNLVSIMREE